jgi:hypothetical protein
MRLGDRGLCARQRGPFASAGRRQATLGVISRRSVSAAASGGPRRRGGAARPAGDAPASSPPPPPPLARAAQRTAAALCAAAVVLAPLPGAPAGLLNPALAADVAKVGTCLLSKCQVALAKCLGDGQCLQVRRGAAPRRALKLCKRPPACSAPGCWRAPKASGQAPPPARCLERLGPGQRRARTRQAPRRQTHAAHHPFSRPFRCARGPALPLQNLVCLNLCNGAADETGCQIKCGDQ